MNALKLHPEEKEVLRKGRDYEQLLNSPGWKRMLDFVEELADGALARMRSSESSDQTVVLAARLAWKQREMVLHLMQTEALDGIEQRKELLEQISGQGFSVLDTDLEEE